MHWHVLQGFIEYSSTAAYQYNSLYLTTIKTCLISNPLCPSRPAHRRRKGCYTAGRGFVHHGCSSLTLRNGSCFSWVSISSPRVSSVPACTPVQWARYKNALPIQGKVGDPGPVKYNGSFYWLNSSHTVTFLQVFVSKAYWSFIPRPVFFLYLYNFKSIPFGERRQNT